MTALRAAAGGGHEAIVDKSGPLAKRAAKSCMAGCDLIQQRLSNQIQVVTPNCPGVGLQGHLRAAATIWPLPGVRALCAAAM